MRRNTLTAISLAALTALTLPAAAAAQTPRPEDGRMGQHGMARPGHDPATRILALRQTLALTEAQIDQIGRVRATLEERNAPLLAQLSAARDQMRAERQQVTPEQREVRRAQMQERREAMQERREAMRDSVERMTPEQREQMRTRMQERAGKVRQRAGAAARPGISDELRPVMEQLRSNTQEAMQQIQSVLTEEQRQKLQELRTAQRHRPAMQRMRRGGGEPGVRPDTPRGRPQGAGPGSR
ncbi:MAG TPA: Spy/CpxP family protein refolding chaperone [Longimicrobiales bacterium]|nr:Spy/CpxP family protein refolding chaperone [Longimicrobiales bacterium]